MIRNKFSDALKLICLLFFMTMGIFFIMAGLLYRAGMPLTDEWQLLVLGAACLIEWGYVMWIRRG